MSRATRTLLCLAALLFSCASPEPAPTQPSAPTPPSLSDPIAVHVLRKSRSVAPRVFGNWSLLAFERLLAAGDVEAFATLAAEASPAGRLYGLAGLWHTSPRLYVARRELALLDSDPVFLGDLPSRTTMARALLSEAFRALTAEWSEPRDIVHAVPGARTRSLAELSQLLRSSDPDDRDLAYHNLCWSRPGLWTKRSNLSSYAILLLPELVSALERELQLSSQRCDMALSMVREMDSLGPWLAEAIERLNDVADRLPDTDRAAGLRRELARLGELLEAKRPIVERLEELRAQISLLQLQAPSGERSPELRSRHEQQLRDAQAQERELAFELELRQRAERRAGGAER